MPNVTVVLTQDVENTPLKKGQEVVLDSQTASLLINVEKVAVLKEDKAPKKAKETKETKE